MSTKKAGTCPAEKQCIQVGGKDYVHCPEHDIFYPKSLEDETELKRKQLKEKGNFGVSLCLQVCPLCNVDMAASLSRLFVSRDNPGQHRKRAFTGPIRKGPR